MNLRQADALSLPFPDQSFDFLYLINVAHHITDPERRQATFEELVRVLRPGGVLFMHEINTVNPLFRFYMGYVFPLIRPIDDGTEEWILPLALPRVRGANWRREVRFFTFLPDFLPHWVQRMAMGAERFLEGSRWRPYSAHFMATLEANPQKL